MPEHVGLFIPLPERLARQYPPEGKEGEDSSPPHLTLVYIGDVPDDRIDELRSVLARIVQAIPPLELKLLPPTTFENKDGQTIVHSPVSGPLLKKAHDAIDTALKRRGFDVQGYDEFKPHVTIEYVDEGEQPRFDYVRPTGQWIAESVGFWVEDDHRSLPFGRRRIHAAAPWYHGSPNRFDEFKQDKWLAFDRKTVKRPVWLTRDKRFAKLQAGANGCVYTVEYQPRKTFPETDLLEMRGRYLQPTKLGAVVEAAIYDGSIDLGVGPEEDALDVLKSMNRLDYDVMETAAVINWARRNRYDSIWVRGDGPDNLMVLDAKAVKIVSRECGGQAAGTAARRDVIACLLAADRPDLANVMAYGPIQSDKGPGDLLRSFNTLAKYNDGLWKSEKQGKFLWSWAANDKFLQGSKEAIAWAKQTGWYDAADKKQRVLQFILVMEGFGKRDITKIRYSGTFVLIDGTGVLAVAGFKVQHPKGGEETRPEPIAGTAKTRFARDRNVVPPINVDPAGDAAREKAKQLKLNEPVIKAIESIPDWRGQDIFVDFHTILMGGGTLSPGQMRVIERNVPLPVMNVGSPDDLLAKMNEMDRWVERVFIPKTSEAWKQIDEDTYQKSLQEVERGWRKKPAEKEDSPARIKREWADYKAGKTKSKQGYDYLVVFHDLQDFISEALKLNLYRALKGSRGMSPEDGYPAFRAVLNDALPKLKRGKPPTKTQMIWLRAMLLVHDRMIGSDGKLSAWIKKRWNV